MGCKTIKVNTHEHAAARNMKRNILRQSHLCETSAWVLTRIFGKLGPPDSSYGPFLIPDALLTSTVLLSQHLAPPDFLRGTEKGQQRGQDLWHALHATARATAESACAKSPPRSNHFFTQADHITPHRISSMCKHQGKHSC